MDDPNGTSESVKLRKCFAHATCFLLDRNTGKRYAVVNRHVSLLSTTDVYVESGNGTKQSLGRPVSVSKTNSQDFGLVEVNDQFSDKVRNQAIVNNANLADAVISNTSISNLYGKSVFKTKSFSNGIISDSPNCMGNIMSREEHESFFKGTDLDTQFCVKGDDVMFAKPGDCGTAVALVPDVCEQDSNGTPYIADSEVEIVGMVCGGSESLGIAYCLFLPVVIGELEREYGMSLSVCLDWGKEQKNAMFKVEESVTLSGTKDIVSLASSRELIGCSTTIYFSILATPEQIAPYAFNLASRALAFMCYKFNAFRPESHAIILSHEQMLKKQVNLRKFGDTFPLFDNNNPDYQVVERGLEAIDCLIRGQLENGERNLKIALACIPKCKNVALRLFAKSLTYIVWLYNSRKTRMARKTAAELLESGIAFFKENTESDGFPKEVGGYLHYELSRHHIQQYDVMTDQTTNTKKLTAEQCAGIRHLAIENARKAVENVEVVHSSVNDVLSLVRVCLMKTELAFALLGCGNVFNVIEERMSVEERDIIEAEGLLEFVTDSVVETGILQGHALKFDLYLIAMCDLRYRKGQLKLALQHAQNCLKFAKEKQDAYNVKRSRVRILVLMDMLRDRKTHNI